METKTAKNVQLGFAEEQEDWWLLTNRFFPSKIGGSVAWLELENIPEAKDIVCDYCNDPCIFLCQIYAGSGLVQHAFHRTIFVFICRNGKCCLLNQSGNIKVLRSQLRLNNAFYPDTPSDESAECDEIKPIIKLCRICGCRGPLICGKCKTISYCGQSHQKLDWKVHKLTCGVTNEFKSTTTDIMFPEFEIIIDQEVEELRGKHESEKEAETRRLREYEELIESGQAGAMAEISDADLNEFSETKEDKTFGRFKKAIDTFETQVLRYNRHGTPLWISDHGMLNQSIVPNCVQCNGRRTFEFQIMPQMLNELKNYELDWGVIVVYTCEKDCDVNGRYVPEFCYKQDITREEDCDADIEIEKLMLNVVENHKDHDNEDIKKELRPSHEVKKKKKSEKEKAASKTFEEKDEWE